MAYAPADVPPELLQEYQALLANHRWDYQNTVPFGSDEFNKHYNNLERIGQLQRAIDPDSILFNDAWKTREAERMKKSGW